MPVPKRDTTDHAPKGAPEVPGADTFTHGGSGEPPTVDPEVRELLESGKTLEVGGDNKLREVKTASTD